MVHDALSNFIQKQIFLCLVLVITLSGYSFAQEVKVIVNTGGTKLTENESTSSKELARLERGEKLDFLEVVFPSGTSSARLKVKYQDKIGYVSAYFMEDNALLEGIIQKEREIIINKNDSIAQQKQRAKEEKAQEYLDKFKINEEEEIRKNDSIADVMWRNAKINSEEARKSRRIVEENRLESRRVKFHEKYGIELGEKIATQKIWIGMSEAMLLDSWGNPNDINRTVTQYTKRSQYVYGSGQYVYVENGTVTAWQD